MGLGKVFGSNSYIDLNTEVGIYKKKKILREKRSFDQEKKNQTDDQ